MKNETMPSCPGIGEFLASGRGELDVAERTALDRHRSACPACGELVAGIRRIERWLPDALAGTPPSADGICPDEATLLALTGAGSLLAAADSERVTGHVSACRHCIGQLSAILAELEPDTAPGDCAAGANEVPAYFRHRARALAGGHAPRRRARWSWVAAVAAAASLAGVALVLGPHAGGPAGDGSPTPLATVRSEAPVDRSEPRLIHPREGMAVSPAGLELRWDPVREAREYTVSVFDAKGELLFQTATADTRAELPPDIRFAPATRYYAWVAVRLADGRSLRSPAVGFETEPGAAP